METAGLNTPKPNILDTIKLDKALRLAKRKSTEGKLEEAKSIYEDILQKFSKNKNALSELQLLSVGPAVATQDPPSDQLQPIINLYIKGQLQQALSETTQMLERFPNAVVLHNIAGAANAGLMQFDAAIASYKQALKIKPDYADAYNNMGNALKDKGNPEAAITSYTQALKIKPDYAEAYCNMGIVLHDEGDFEAAIVSYKQALKIKPDYAEAYNNMAISQQSKGGTAAAINSYTEALKVKPDYAEAYYNMGVALQSKGDLDAAMVSYKHALKIKPDYAEAYNNMGNALKDKDDLEAAIASYTQALKIKPDYAEAYNNKGSALQGKGDSEAAIVSYKQALKIKPNYAEAYNNIGNALKDKGDPEAAITNYTQALKIKPNAEAYNNMGSALMDKGDLEAAIASYTQALKIKPDYAEAYNNMGIILEGLVVTKPIPGLKGIISTMLSSKNYVRPTDISKATISLLKFEPAIVELFEKHSAGEVEQSLERLISNLSKVPLLLELMSICPLDDLELETALRDIRLALLLSVSEISNAPEILSFQSALALQCFTNEYVYNQSDKESTAIAALEVVVEKTLSTGQQPTPQSILCLASYKALHHYKWNDLLNFTQLIEDVFTRQALEPKREIQLKFDIPTLQEITNKVSSKVRQQYEKNPYPRWIYVGTRLNPIPISKVIQEVGLKTFDQTINEVEAPSILVAGCGTGQHSIGTASRYKNGKILAVDLSLSSLAYAKRKTKELGLRNIDYMQADILDLGKLNRKFEIIESSGVLHHMDDPMAGWRVLTDCLSSGGLMNIGLYSELARQHIVRMREEINQLGIDSTDIAMKSFRGNLIKSEKIHHKLILASRDFYSLSTLRDLLFHVQEHRFTIPQIKNCLDELDLKFCGFEAHKIVKDFKLTNPGAGDPYDLDKWTSYENANPYSFGGMYQFWCQKTS
jgi:tetratricopeptide (TPR) repeat protein/SAM-dependent methyltransferase